jgi:hypothetical protein
MGASAGGAIADGTPPPGARWLLRLATVRRWRSLALQNREFPFRVPPAVRLRAWAQRFSYRDWLLCELDRHDPADYLPHHASLDYGLRFPAYRSLNDKLLFARALAALDLGHPRLLAYVRRGRLISFAGAEPHAPAADWLAEAAARGSGIVLKPVIGLAGSGLLFLRRGRAGLTANGSAVGPGGLEQVVAGLDHYLVSELVEQAGYAAAIFPQATNTVRVLTLWDPGPNRPFVAAAAHRFGNSRSLPVDNFHAGSGGLCSDIAIDSGRLGAAVVLDERGVLRRHERHPESGAAIAGVAVPAWSEVLAAVLRAAAGFAESPFVGWDIVIGERGPVFLEANVPPSIHIWQVHGGLLRDPRARAFFAAQGMAGHGRGGGKPQPAAARPGKGSSPRSSTRRSRPAARFPGGIAGTPYSGYPLQLRARLGLLLSPWRRLAALLAADRRDPLPLTASGRLHSWRRGFRARHWQLYDLDHHDPGDYVPDFAALDYGVRDANLRAPEDGILFAHVLSSLGLAQPRLLALLALGRLHAGFSGNDDPGPPAAWLAEALRRRGALVLRPVQGRSPAAPVFLRAAGSGLEAGGRAVDAAGLERLLAGLDQYLVREYAPPPPYAAAICPAEAGSLRILTLWRPGESRPFIAAVVHRFGPPRALGLLAAVDPATGELGEAVTLDASGCRRCHEAHPRTGAVIAGTVVPGWSAVREAVIAAAVALPSAPLLGWDVIPGECGPCFLGADAPPAFWPWQARRGLLADPRVRAFFEDAALVRPRADARGGAR